MKIGILTFHAADNYGAVLQAYGLKEVLYEMGHQVSIIDYKPKYLTEVYRIFRFQSGDSTHRIFRNISVVPFKLIRHKHFSKFRKKRLNPYPMNRIADMDVLIVGSDQVWNPNLTGGKFDSVFLLTELTKAKRIAYAVSAGNCESFKQNISSSVVAALKCLDAISVRETNLQRELRDIGIESNVVLDPVLLAGQRVFDSLVSRKYVPNYPYILSFSLTYDSRLKEKAYQIAYEKGVKVVELCSTDESLFHPALVQTASVEKFVSLIKFAEGIVTSSFHGTAFSILFNRPFLSIGYDRKHSERSRELLHSIGLLRCYSDMDSMGNSEMMTPDYDTVNQRLEQLRTLSLLFIEGHITPPNLFTIVIKTQLNDVNNKHIYSVCREGLAA